MSILIIEHSDSTGSERLGARLQRDGHRLHIVRVHLGELLPKDLDEIDGVISCGGPQAPDCKEPWVDEELNLLRTADQKQLPVLGICLGCQLLARALGGEVSPSKTPEMGWYNTTMTADGREDVLFSGQPWMGCQFQWHHWEISSLPENAILLASSDRCKVQAWMRGICTYGVQFHPECQRSTMDSWIADDIKTLSEAGIDSKQITSESNKRFAEYERLTNRFFDAVSHLLMPMHARLARQRH